MAKFLTTSGITYQVELIIKEAQKKLVLISPFVQISKMLFERLQNASDKGVQIILIYGKGELKKTEKKQLENIENLKLYFYENLHAKCYFNEKSMVVTSMNLYEFSEKNNREMGIFISKTDDIEMFNEAVEETLSVIKSAKLIKSNTISNSIFPLKEEQFIEVNNFFQRNYKFCRINSTSTYVYCEDLLPFSDVMFREGFELRFNWGLYSQNLLQEKITSISLDNLDYNYEYEVYYDINGTTRILFTTKNASDLTVLLKDYKKLREKIADATKKVSYKSKSF